MSVVYDYHPTSDRSAKDRSLYKKKLYNLAKKNLQDRIIREGIIARSKWENFKISLPRVKEYKFVYGDNHPQSGQGDGSSQPGDIFQQGQDGTESGKAGDRPGEDVLDEIEITWEEAIKMMFEDAKLPDLEPKAFQEIESEHARKKEGFRKKAPEVFLDPKQTLIAYIKRREAARHEGPIDEENFPIDEADLRYRDVRPDIERHSNAVIIYIRDASGSMDERKVWLLWRLLTWLSVWINLRYRNTQERFVIHDVLAQEVNEVEFFGKVEGGILKGFKSTYGGTYMSSGVIKAMELIRDHYPPELWNIYVFYASDGENFSDDNERFLELVNQSCGLINLFGYIEIKPKEALDWGSMIKLLDEKIKASNLGIVKIRSEDDYKKSILTLLNKERMKDGDKDA